MLRARTGRRFTAAAEVLGLGFGLCLGGCSTTPSQSQKLQEERRVEKWHKDYEDSQKAKALTMTVNPEMVKGCTRVGMVNAYDEPQAFSHPEEDWTPELKRRTVALGGNTSLLAADKMSGEA